MPLTVSLWVKRFNFPSSSFLIWKLKASDENVYKGPSSALGTWQAINNCLLNRCDRMVDHLHDDQLQLWQDWRERSHAPPPPINKNWGGGVERAMKRHHGDPFTLSYTSLCDLQQAPRGLSLLICISRGGHWNLSSPPAWAFQEH